MPTKRPSVAALLAVLLIGYQAPAVADTFISGEYYEQASIAKNCYGSYGCRLDFDPIPANKFLDIQQINCSITNNQPLVSLAMGSSETQGGGSNRVMVYPLQPITPGDGYYYYSINEEVIYRMGARPYLYFATRTVTSANTTIQCAVTGKLTSK